VCVAVSVNFSQTQHSSTHILSAILVAAALQSCLLYPTAGEVNAVS
jgi:hypothetical protein